MKIEWRYPSRSTVRVTVAALVALLLAWSVSGGGCSGGGAKPEGTAKAFVQAVRAGDSDGVYQLLGPDSHSFLEQAAKEATNRAGGDMRYTPEEMIHLSPRPELGEPRDYEVEKTGEGQSTVWMVSPDGKKEPLHLVKINGRWRVELRDALKKSMGDDSTKSE